MIRGLYSAASGMISLERRQEALSDNLANAQTPGYKKDDTVLRAFPNLLMQRIRDFNDNGTGQVPGAPNIPGRPVQIGELYNGVYLQERVPSFSQGTLVQSDNPLDIAIDDQGLAPQLMNGKQVKPAAFFTVQLPDGTVGYTRNGKWDVDSAGNLVTSDGYRILGANQQSIQLTGSISKSDIHISADGQLIAYPGDLARTRVAGQIGIATAENPNELRRIGGSTFQSDIPLAINNQGVTIQQGFIEQSNVDPGQTMTEMMVTVRGYEANQKVIGVYNTSLEQLYSVGKING